MKIPKSHRRPLPVCFQGMQLQLLQALGNGIRYLLLCQDVGFHANAWPISNIITHDCAKHGGHYFLNQKNRKIKVSKFETYIYPRHNWTEASTCRDEGLAEVSNEKISPGLAKLLQKCEHVCKYMPIIFKVKFQEAKGSCPNCSLSEAKATYHY